MSRLLSQPALKTLCACAAIECVVFLLFLAGTGLVVAAAYYTLVVGPLSLFVAPFLYRRFAATQRDSHLPVNRDRPAADRLP